MLGTYVDDSRSNNTTISGGLAMFCRTPAISSLQWWFVESNHDTDTPAMSPMAKVGLNSTVLSVPSNRRSASMTRSPEPEPLVDMRTSMPPRPVCVQRVIFTVVLMTKPGMAEQRPLNHRGEQLVAERLESEMHSRQRQTYDG